jgi:hypothetical protein
MTEFKRFRITKAATSPVYINVNSKSALFPLGVEHGLDDQPGLTRQEILGALDGSNVEYELVGEAPAPAVDALVEAGGAGGIIAPSAESAPGEKPDPHGVISAPSAGFSKGEDVEGGDSTVMPLVGGGDDVQDMADFGRTLSLDDDRRSELLAILDKSIPDVESALDGLALNELAILYAAEKDGKSRKGVISAIEARFADPDLPTKLKGDDE